MKASTYRGVLYLLSNGHHVYQRSFDMPHIWDGNLPALELGYCWREALR